MVPALHICWLPKRRSNSSIWGCRVAGANLLLELQALTTTVTTLEIYALVTATTGVSFVVIAMALLQARLARYGSDAGQA